jgi:hypothetical protein
VSSPPLHIREGRAVDFARLGEIAVASKAFWGYDLAQVEEWAETGGFDRESLSKRLVYVAECEGEPVGCPASVRVAGSA